ncbi:hypothetical protein N7466_000715 [Penicillium verhagenii]|uniref:uncharacterized protein n=1 Tax=Penicillium verhagenii TaxID=1562060 RepID=UPI00254534C1|nr:uncharacterized protein N7466_000715 [Penicillium verhagenii]KAJ5947700.1 hypothetical protein N7466_000715 [Penicillium verhagenii]
MTAFSVDYNIEALIDKPHNTDTDNNWNNIAIATRTDQGMGLTVVKLTINPLKNPLQKAEDYDS